MEGDPQPQQPEANTTLIREISLELAGIRRRIPRLGRPDAIHKMMYRITGIRNRIRNSDYNIPISVRLEFYDMIEGLLQMLRAKAVESMIEPTANPNPRGSPPPDSDDPGLVGSGHTYRLKFLKKFKVKDKSYSLEELSKISGEPLATLKEVAKRGFGAYKTQPSSVRMKGTFKKGINAPMSMKLSPQQWSMARVYSYIMKNPKHDADLRGGVVPDRNTLQQMAMATISTAPPSQIGESVLIGATPTVKFYLNGNTVIVAIRGSREARDWYNNNLRIPFDNLRSGNRYAEDSEAIKKIQQQYPHGEYEYYGVAHSLGGALMDEFLGDGLIDSGISYNPAVQPKELGRVNKNERIYNEGDPLYQLMGRQLTKKPEVRPEKQNNLWWSSLKKYAPLSAFGLAASATDYLAAHKLKTFRGGNFPQSYKNTVLYMYQQSERMPMVDRDKNVKTLLEYMIQKNRGTTMYELMINNLANELYTEITEGNMTTATIWVRLGVIIRRILTEPENQILSGNPPYPDEDNFEGMGRGSSEKWIQGVIAHMKTGAFKAQSARVGKTPKQYAKEVLAHPAKHTLTTRRRAQFLENISR